MRCVGFACGVLTLWVATALSATEMNFTAISIPTRDGKTLAADLWYLGATPASKPVILIQTPYNRLLYRLGKIPGAAGGDMFPESPAYNYVVVDWRGFYGSAGAAVTGYDRGLDGYDSVEWIAAQTWCNGKVGTWGSSALGYIQFQTAQHRPPHLVCCVPRVKSLRNEYPNYYYGGVYRKEHVESMESLGLISSALVLAHPTYDNYWKLVKTNGIQASEIEVPMLIVGGWYDHFPDSVLETFEELRTAGHAAARSHHRLIFGPWLHGGLGALEQGILEYPDAAEYNGPKALQFLDRYLLGANNGWDDEPVIQYYRLGEGGWAGATSWTGIARQTLNLNLLPGRRLDTRYPEASAPDTYAYDPANPTPVLGGSRFGGRDSSIEQGPADLAAIEARGDVLVYSTDILNEDLRINGGIKVDLQISSDRLDTDFCVRLTDVFPDGTSVLMTQGIRRARYRNSYESETLLTPGAITPVTVELQQIALTIQAGHRLRIVVCSADYPHFDKNLNDGGPQYTDATGLIATNSIHHAPGAVSRVALQILPAASPPPEPAGLEATAQGTNRIALAWLDRAISETSIALEWSANGVSGWTALATLPADTTGYDDTSVPPGTTRHYRLRAVNGAGASANSNVASATTESLNRAPILSSGPDADPQTAYLGEAITFTVEASDADEDELTIAWNFGDGSLGTGASTEHTFITAGTYEVTVTVSDGEAEPVSGSVTVHVLERVSDLYLKTGKFTLNWAAHEQGKPADRLTLSGMLNPAGSSHAPEGAILQATVNGTALIPVLLDARGNGSATEGDASAKASFKSKTGSFSFTLLGADLRAALGLENVDESGSVELKLEVRLTGAGLDNERFEARAVFSYTTRAGKSTQGSFAFKSHVLASGVFLATRSSAIEDASGRHKVSMVGLMAASDGMETLPASLVTLTVGHVELEIPLDSLHLDAGGAYLLRGSHAQLTKFVLSGSKKSFQWVTLPLELGVPLAGEPELAHRLPLRLNVPTATGIRVFETVVELLRTSPASKSWKR